MIIKKSLIDIKHYYYNMMNKAIQYMLLCTAIVAVFALTPKISQDPSYHNFADQRSLIGIPNAGDVFSNIIFLCVGVKGLYDHRHKFSKVDQYWLRILYFVGVGLTSLGSAYYHYAPINATLVWDRLPMAIIFMSMLSLIIEQKLMIALGWSNILKTAAQFITIFIGILSVLVWAVYDDLRLYIVVQFGSIIYVLYSLFNVYRQYGGPGMMLNINLVIGIFCYILAKICEHGDLFIFTSTHGCISGHSIKHVLAGIGAYYSGVHIMCLGIVTNRCYVGKKVAV